MNVKKVGIVNVAIHVDMKTLRKYIVKGVDLMNLKLNVLGLGHPTRWHVSINNDFATKEEAENLKTRLENLIDNTCILPADELNREPTEEETKSAKEADKYYREHEPISFNSKTNLFQHLKALERAGYIIPEWIWKYNEHGDATKVEKMFKVNSDAVNKK